MKNKLLQIAEEMRDKAYAPYSHYTVGAAVLCGSGKIYTGCNIENAAFSPTVCAERVAIFKAISEGEREFCALAVAGGAEGEDSCAYPCGTCRQVMAEFFDKDTPIYISLGDMCREIRLRELLPHSFGIKEGS